MEEIDSGKFIKSRVEVKRASEKFTQLAEHLCKPCILTVKYMASCKSRLARRSLTFCSKLPFDLIPFSCAVHTRTHTDSKSFLSKRVLRFSIFHFRTNTFPFAKTSVRNAHARLMVAKKKKHVASIWGIMDVIAPKGISMFCYSREER